MMNRCLGIPILLCAWVVLARDPIALKLGRTVVIRQILPTDCRVVRGFTHSPVDGREDTRYSNNVVGEWGGSGGTPAVNYRRFNGNNGLHVTLPPGGFDVVQTRGDWRGRIYLNSDFLKEPKATTTNQREARRVSFFYDTGALTQASFFRLGGNQPEGRRVSIEADTVWKDWRQAIGAVSLNFYAKQAVPGSVITVRVGDVLDSRRFASIIDFAVPGPGKFSVTIDLPDQVFLPPSAEWSTKPRLDGVIVPEPRLRVSIETAGSVEIAETKLIAHVVPRHEALPDAVAWRKLLVRGLFSALSEPRPWMLLKNGSPIREQITTHPTIRRYERAILEVLENVEIARQLAPDDKLIVQYHDWIYQNLDKGKPLPKPRLSDMAAPRWATLIRDNWIEQAHIASWWLDNRHTPNGEFGGGPQDDTDLMQSWQCLPMIESEPLGTRLNEAGAKLSEIMLEHHLEEGMNRRSLDALHAYEEGINQLALDAWWNYGDPIHFERVMESARSVTKLMLETPDGRVHFPSNRKIGIHETRDGELMMGQSSGNWNWAPIRLLFHPLYVVADYHQNPAVLERYTRWGETWAGYQAPNAFVDKVDIRTGKPVHQSSLPASANIAPVDEFLALYLLTGDAKWQRPFTMGMDGGGFNGAPIQYGRSIHHLVRWPEPYQTRLRRSADNGYAGFFANQDRDMLTGWLEKSLSWFQRYRHMNTAAEQKTDRILTYNATTPLSCYLGDAPNRNRWLNLGAVSYEGLRGRDFAALVWDADSTTLRVALYNFTDRKLSGLLRVWRLEHGEYHLRMGVDQDDDGGIDYSASEQQLELQRHSSITLNLAPRVTTVMELKQTKRLAPIRSRADLALSHQDGSVRVHNIGARDAENVRVILRRGENVVDAVEINHLAAPRDLHPRSRIVRFAAPLQQGDLVETDPADLIPEITESNNRLRITRTEDD